VRWTLLALAGCNQIFGLPETTHVGDYYDAHVDAPYACPPLGGTPQFGRVLEQLVIQPVVNYSETLSGRGVGVCIDSSGRHSVCEGPIGMPLAPIPSATPSTLFGLVARMTQDGERILVLPIDTVGQINIYRRGDTTWTTEAPFPVTGVADLSPLAATATGNRVLLRTSANGSVYEEWSDDTGVWQRAVVHPLANIAPLAYTLRVTADGLHAVVHTGDLKQTYYTDRPTVNDQFRAATLLADTPRDVELYLTNNCSRLYAAGLGSVFYAKQ
jgi:hypothetical protein